MTGQGEAPSGDEPVTDAAADDELERLRRLVIGLDSEEFATLVRMMRDPAQRTVAVADVLSEAVARRAQADESLGDTLAPTIEGALHRSIDRNPEPIANAIYPVIGPSVRKAISSALADMLAAINRTVELQFSPRALRWRVEAWRAGVSYTEYLFANNVNYVIEHVFLFHRETSLLLQHVAADPEFEADSDMVSSMLSAMSTALTDFMADSFSSDTEAARRAWSVDDHNIQVQAGEFAVVALVTRGTPPATKLGELGDFLDRAHVQYREPLRDFEGDASTFAALRPQMEDLLRSAEGGDGADAASVASGPGLRGTLLRWPVLLLGALLLGGFGYLSWLGSARADAARALVDAYEAAPGIAVIDWQRSADVVRITGLRDPLAQLPERPPAPVALEVVEDWRPFFSAEPAFVEARLVERLAAQDGVRASVADGVVALSGVASERWLDQASAVALATPGIVAVDADGLALAVTPAERVAAMAAVVEREELHFESGAFALGDEQRAAIEALAEDVRALLALTDELGTPRRVLIIGQSDGTGTLARNSQLSRRRAEVVRDALVSVGVPAERLAVEGRIIGEVDADARQVRFELMDEEEG